MTFKPLNASPKHTHHAKVYISPQHLWITSQLSATEAVAEASVLVLLLQKEPFTSAGSRAKSVIFHADTWRNAGTDSAYCLKTVELRNFSSSLVRLYAPHVLASVSRSSAVSSSSRPSSVSACALDIWSPQHSRSLSKGSMYLTQSVCMDKGRGGVEWQVWSALLRARLDAVGGAKDGTKRRKGGGKKKRHARFEGEG